MWQLNLTLLLIFSFGKTWIRVERTREQHTLDLHMGTPWETVTLTAFGRNKEMYYSILEEGKFIHQVPLPDKR